MKRKKYLFRNIIIGISVILLLPLCIISTAVLGSLLHYAYTKETFFSYEAFSIIFGAGIWIIIYLILPPPARLYIIGHELSHVFSALLFGARVKKIRIFKNSGSVIVSKSNPVITLAPYFFPFYTIILIIFYYLLNLIFNMAQYRYIWLSLIGAAWAFHITMTAGVVNSRQPDIQRYGIWFSFLFVYLLNISGLILWMFFLLRLSFYEFTGIIKNQIYYLMNFSIKLLNIFRTYFKKETTYYLQ